MGQPRRPHCGAFSGAWTDAGIGVAYVQVLQWIRAQCLQCFVWTFSCKCNISFIPCLHAVSTASSNASCPVVAGQIVRFGSLKSLEDSTGPHRGGTRSNGKAVTGLILRINSAND